MCNKERYHRSTIYKLVSQMNNMYADEGTPFDRPASTMSCFVAVTVGTNCSRQAKVTDLHLYNSTIFTKNVVFTKSQHSTLSTSWAKRTTKNNGLTLSCLIQRKLGQHVHIAQVFKHLVSALSVWSPSSSFHIYYQALYIPSST